jgi:hypothetical protein
MTKPQVIYYTAQNTQSERLLYTVPPLQAGCDQTMRLRQRDAESSDGRGLGH